MMISIELQILLDAIRSDFMGYAAEPIDLASVSIDIHELLALAHHHGCVWEVVAYGKHYQLFDAEELAQSRLVLMQSTAYVLQREQQQLRLIQALAEAEISFAILKGDAVYPLFRSESQQQSRQSADIDILIKAESLPKAVKLLTSMGFVCQDTPDAQQLADFATNQEQCLRAYSLEFVPQDGGVSVDIHWQIANYFSLPIKSQDVFKRLEQVDIHGMKVPTLAFNDHFLLLCIHGYLDRFFQLKHLADIYLAMQQSRYDREAIFLQASSYGVLQQVQDSCATASLFFDQLPSLQVAQSSHYAQSVLRRYIAFENKPPRMHPGRGQWRLFDKFRYIKHQINTRSRHASCLAPIVSRLKYDAKMLANKPKAVPALLWWPLAYVSKVWQR